MRFLLVLAAAGCALACGPETKPPVKITVLAFVPDKLKYEPAQVTLNTVRNIVSMRGDVGNIIGGAQLVIDPNDPSLITATTEEEIRRAITKSAGGPVNINLAQRDDVFYPADFHSWNIATTYYNFERTYFFYEGLGLTLAQVTPPPDIFYFPDLYEGENRQQEKDNAAFFPLLQAFLILPHDLLQHIPLSMNLGVMAHEYTHNVFDLRVHNRKQVSLINDWAPYSATPGLNLLSALDEGFADLMGTGVTCGPAWDRCDTRFVAASIDQIKLTRDIDGIHCMDQAMWDAQRYESAAGYRDSGKQYFLGTVFASSAWRGARGNVAPPEQPPAAAAKAVMQAAYNVMSTGSKVIPGLSELIERWRSNQSKFRLESDLSNGVVGVLDAFVQQLQDPLLKANVCSALLDRFNKVLTDDSKIPSCPSTAQRYKECP